MYNYDDFFFGEDFTLFGLHVVHTAWIFTVIDFMFIVLLTGVFNMTIGRWDAFSILLGLLFFSVLSFSVYGIIVRRYIYIYPIVVCKAAEFAITALFLLIGSVFVLFKRKFVLDMIASRVPMIEGETSWEVTRIVISFVYLICQLMYSIVTLYVFYSTMDYFRRRTLFAYRARLEPTHDFILRIHSVRQSAARSSPVPEPVWEKEEEVEKVAMEEKAESPPLPPPSPSPSPSPHPPLERRPSTSSERKRLMADLLSSYHEEKEWWWEGTRQHSVPVGREERVEGGRHASMPSHGRRRSTTNERHVTFKEVAAAMEETRRSSIPWNGRRGSEYDWVRSGSVPESRPPPSLH